MQKCINSGLYEYDCIGHTEDKEYELKAVDWELQQWFDIMVTFTPFSYRDKDIYDPWRTKVLVQFMVNYLKTVKYGRINYETIMCGYFMALYANVIFDVIQNLTLKEVQEWLIKSLRVSGEDNVSDISAVSKKMKKMDI